jgi:tetratricopeptide (TPR) repeat protein
MKFSTLIVIAASLVGMAATAQDSTAPAARFDMQVRNDFFAGFTGDQEALLRAMKICEEALAKDAKNAEALVWHGAGTFFESGQSFQAGDMAKGQQLWQLGLKEMDEAVQLAPDRVGVRVPRGATLLTAARRLQNPAMARPLIETAIGDYERALDVQKKSFDSLGAHPRGELLLGLADGYARLGNEDQAKTYFERIRTALPGSPYAASADKWLATKTLAPREAGCLGCHVAK